MAHGNHDGDLAYRRLQQRLDRMVTGAPDSPALQAILRLLFTPDEAELAARMPTLCTLGSLARRVDRDPSQLEAVITSMAERGLVIDLEYRGERWVMLAPTRTGSSPTPSSVAASSSGHGCGAPLRTCLSFNEAADALVRMGLADPISNEEGLAVLEESKHAGLAQTADNVQRDGKLGDLLLDTVPGAGPQAMARVLQVLEKSPPAQALRAVEPLRSVFLRALLAVVHAGAGVSRASSGR